LLALLCLVSLLARAAWLEQPCRSPCRAAADHTLIFDETYYVNAARRLAGVAVPRADPYATAPRGVDPNSEHPQLAKLMLAGAIELFGDVPLAWRLGSLLFGTLAIVGMFALVRAAGGGPWLALVAAALMAADNLLLVHGRIGTLDIVVVAFMIWGAALYLRGRPIGAGALIGIGACVKLVAPYALLALATYEAVRNPRRICPLLVTTVIAAGTFIALLAAMDALAPPYDQVKHLRIAGGPFAHIGHMLSFAAAQVGNKGIASYPWQWFGDYQPIVYLNIVPSQPAPGLVNVHPASHFLGVVSPPILLLAIPGLILAARRFGDADRFAIAWVLGTLVPFELLSAIWHRTSYLYYMVIVMPGVYIAVGRLVTHPRAPRRLVQGWVGLVLAAVIIMYPFTPLP
jgi:predicted membrane-bound dolichyl-phosphate-mannose-protein mannosyltransferase